MNLFFPMNPNNDDDEERRLTIFEIDKETDELNTIPEKESEAFIKSSVEDLVLIPSESKDTPGSDKEQAARINSVFQDQNPPQFFISLVGDNDDDDYNKGSIISTNTDIFETPSSDAITTSSLIKEPKDSLIIGNKELNTIPEKESEAFIKSSVEDLVLIPSESEDTSGSDNFISSDDESLSDEDVLKDNLKIYSNPLFEFDDEYISSDVNPILMSYYDSKRDILYLESLLNDDLVHYDSSIPVMSVTSILEGFIDEPPLEENDDLFDLEPKNDDWKNILYDAPIFMTDNIVFHPEIHDQNFSSTYVSLPFEDRHYLFFTYVIQIVLLYFTYPMVSNFLFSSGSKDTIFDLDISAFHFSHRYGDGKPFTCCGCEGPLNGGFCLFCASRARNSFAYDPNLNSFDDSQNLSDYPQQPQNRVTIKTLVILIIHIIHQVFFDVQTVGDLMKVFNESTIPLSDIISQLPPSIVITTSPPVLPIEDPEVSLIMGNEELNTIPEKESDEFIKFSVEELVPIPSESEDTSWSDSEYVLPSCDDFSPIDVFEEKSVTFSNPLFDSKDDFTSSDDESLSDEDVPEDNDIECKDSYDSNLDESTFPVTPFFDSNEDEYFATGDDIELLLYRDPSTPMMSVVSILDGFTDEPHLEENDDLFDLKSKKNEWKKILYDAPIDDLMIEDKIFDPDILEKNFSQTYVSLPFTDRHYLFFTCVVLILLIYFTYPVNSPFLLSSRSEDTIFDLGISAFHFPHRSRTSISFNVYLNILNESSMEICSSARFNPNIKMIWEIPYGEIKVHIEVLSVLWGNRLLIQTVRCQGLHKGYDKMQKILSQLNQLKAKPEDKDINLKFLRALPSSWSQTLEVDVKGYTTFSSSQSAGPSHYAFVSATSASKKMSQRDSPSYSSTTTYSAPLNSKVGSHISGNVIEDVLQSFVVDTKPEQQLAYKDFEHIEKLHLGEMDLKWQMAMISVRVHKFEKKVRRKIDFDKKESARFNKKKVRCYKCQQRGHFARECRAEGGNDKQRYSSFKIKEIGKKEEDSKALITVDTLVDWTDHDGESDGVVASKKFSMIAGCAAKIYNLITRADTEEASTAGDVEEFALMGVTSERNSSKNMFRLIDSFMSVRTKVGLGFNNCIRENKFGWDDSAFSVFTTNSEDVKGRPLFHRFAKANSIKVVPPPLSGDYTSLSDHGDLDESQMSYGTKSLTSSDSKSVSNDFFSCDDSDKSSEVNTNNFAFSDSSVKSTEPKPNDSTLCASTSNVSTSEHEAEIESNVGTPIQEPIIV
nr:ribonuclease H-like domain-containing protein [Tanacetum cinerariifolium]